LPRTYTGLSKLDRFLRDLPPETYFRTFAMDAAAYIGDIILQIMGRPVEHAWRWEPDQGDIVLAVDAADYWVDPIAIIAKVWVGKDPKSLSVWIREQAYGIYERLPPLAVDEEEEGDEEAEDES